MPNVRPLNENKYHMSKDRYDELRSRCYQYWEWRKRISISHGHGKSYPVWGGRKREPTTRERDRTTRDSENGIGRKNKDC